MMPNYFDKQAEWQGALDIANKAIARLEKENKTLRTDILKEAADIASSKLKGVEEQDWNHACLEIEQAILNIKKK